MKKVEPGSVIAVKEVRDDLFFLNPAEDLSAGEAGVEVAWKLGLSGIEAKLYFRKASFTA